MDFKKTFEKKVEPINSDLFRYITKKAKEVKVKDTLLEGESAKKRKSRYKDLKGGFNWILARGLVSKWKNEFNRGLFFKRNVTK